jgi:hypothetical protein
MVQNVTRIDLEAKRKSIQQHQQRQQQQQQ